jgi:NAD(P)-dependent dehydrogenase (short-subunit alcohol dehydrogenase family)
VRAIVTGGASGIGAATVAQLRSAGHDVVVWDRAGTADVVVDVSDPESVDAAMAATLESGPVPQLVAACAGIGHSGQLLAETPEKWDQVLAVNLTGAWLTIRATAAAMTEAAATGSIVVVTSVSGTLVDRDMGAYCVSKAGADMLVKVAAVELGRHGIRVNGVGPGVTRTPMLAKPEALPGWVDGLTERTALGRLGEAEDVAQAIVAVLGLQWVTGQIVHADGGLSLHSPIDAYGQIVRLRAGTPAGGFVDPSGQTS